MTSDQYDRLDLVVLACLWCQGGKPLNPSGLSTKLKAMLLAGAAKQELPASLARLEAAGRVERIEPTRKGTGVASFKISAGGERHAAQALGRTELPSGRTPFTALAGNEIPAIAARLPIPKPDKKAALAATKLLIAAVVVRHLGLNVPLDRGPDAARLAIVKLALSQAHQVPMEKIYLKKLPAGELPALVAAPMLGAAGTAASSLDKLLETQACRILGASKPTPAQIKSAVVRQWLGDPGANAAPQTLPAAAVPVDLKTFSERALTAAKDAARNGSNDGLGNRVLIHCVWQQFGQMYGPIPEEQFKKQLSDANGDYIVLVREDLIPDDRRQDYYKSEVSNGPSKFHYIRI